MTSYQYEDPVGADISHPWIQQRLEQLEAHFREFLTSREGRFYVLFGGCHAGKTSLLKTIHHQFLPVRVQEVGATSEEETPKRRLSIGLRRTLATRFDEEELRTLCFDLGIGYDDLPSKGTANKARELIAYLERRDQIDKLIEVGKQVRPDIPWRSVIEEPRKGPCSVLIDLDAAGYLSSPSTFFKHLYTEIRRQLDICSIDPERVARLFQDDRKALPDFKEAFNLIISSPGSRSIRLILLLDNADVLAQTSFASELFTSLVKLFSNPTYTWEVTRQLDVVMAGGVPLYNQLVEVRFPRKLKHWYNIEVLPREAAQVLIVALPDIQGRPDLIDEVLRYTGGQPYLLQYFMSHLSSKGQPITDKILEQVAEACLEPRSEIVRWFHDCFEAIEQQGARAIYAALATGQTMGWPQIMTTIQERKLGDTAALRDPDAIDRALDVLLFHGLVRHDRIGETGRYVITSELFREWFVNHLSPEEKTKIVMGREIAMTPLANTVSIMYDILKWLREERERDQEESVRPSPPSETLEAAPAEAALGPPVSTPDAILAALEKIDLTEERANLDRLSSLGRQLQSRRENINLYEEELAEMPVGRERISLRKGFRRERAEVERIAREMQVIVERLSGHQVIVRE